jgi:8-oxo-dGTP pyrophosphatase MutT (NUDIX family)
VLTAEEISTRLRQNGRHGAGNDNIPALRRAAVLVPFLWQQDQWHLLFTRRTDTVQSHKGQVSFPGGAADPYDPTAEQTALRETYEEIGLSPEGITVLGRLPEMPTITNYLVTPIVAQINWPVTFNLSPHEVSRVFTIPLAWLAEPANREEHPRLLPNGVTENVIYYQPYDGEMLWGVSARIMVDLLVVLGLAE